VRRARILALAIAAGSLACTEPLLSPNTGTSRAELFDAVWHEVDLHYSMFALKAVNWDSIGRVYRPLALAASNDAALAKTVGSMLMTLRDRHVSLTPGVRSAPIVYRTSGDSTPTTFDAALVQQRYLTGGTTTRGGHVQYGRLSTDVGYIRIATFADEGWAAEIDEAIAALEGVRSMVVDVRSNPGGSYAVAMQTAGRFAEDTRTFGYVRIRNGPRHDDFTGFIPEVVRPEGPKQFRGQVYVLANRKTYSSGENFVLALRAFGNVITVGDTTAGSSGKPIVRELPNGWTYQLSSWIEYTTERVAFEDVGLPPDEYVGDGGAASRAKTSAARSDATIDRALALAASPPR
jgi:carboxyl-terminal processing protease